MKIPNIDGVFSIFKFHTAGHTAQGVHRKTSDQYNRSKLK